MVLMALFTTFITTPVVMSLYKPARMSGSDYKHRTIQRKKIDTQLRLLACFNSARNIPTLINLMEVSRGTRNKEGLCVYAMHMMELSERSSAILMVHKARRNGMPFWDRNKDSNPNQIVIAFETFQHLSQVSVRPTTAISSMSTMHEDICNSAYRKKVAMIILPFHKRQRLDGQLETTRAELRHVNLKVLEHSPCSVGILVDRGLGGASHVPASNVDYTLTIFFFGGHDDREALSYGAIMAEHPGVSLTVVRFVVDPRLEGGSVQLEMDGRDGPEEAGSTDEEFLAEFKRKISRDGSIRFEESKVSNGGEAVAAMRRYNRSNLIIVGRMPEGQLATALNNTRNECPELGPVGNLLILPEFLGSVLVVQQFRSPLTGDSLNSLMTPTIEGESDS